MSRKERKRGLGSQWAYAAAILRALDVVKNATRVQRLLQSAIQSHQAGQIAEAERLYGQVLAIDPNHVDSLHNLSLIAHLSGRADLAMRLISQAIALNDLDSNCHNTFAMILRRAGRTRGGRGPLSEGTVA